MATQNKCGECTACCFHTEIQAVNSPAGELCSKCDQDCTIYEDRPEACRSFECLYFQHDIPEGLRPDKCGIMFEMPYNCDVYIGYERKAEAHSSPEVLELVRKVNEAGVSVAIVCMDGMKRYSLGAGRSRAAMHESINRAVA